MDDGSPGYNIMTDLIWLIENITLIPTKLTCCVKCKFNLEDTTFLISKNNFKFDTFSTLSHFVWAQRSFWLLLISVFLFARSSLNFICRFVERFSEVFPSLCSNILYTIMSVLVFSVVPCVQRFLWLLFMTWWTIDGEIHKVIQTVCWLNIK